MHVKTQIDEFDNEHSMHVKCQSLLINMYTSGHIVYFH